MQHSVSFPGRESQGINTIFERICNENRWNPSFEIKKEQHLYICTLKIDKHTCTGNWKDTKVESQFSTMKKFIVKYYEQINEIKLDESTVNKKDILQNICISKKCKIEMANEVRISFGLDPITDIEGFKEAKRSASAKLLADILTLN